jgi:hypothetical protein
MSDSRWFSGQITVSRQDSQQQEEVRHRDTGAGNGTHYCFKDSGLMNIDLVCNMIYIYIYIYIYIM